MKFRMIALATALFAAMSGVASAADMPTKAPPRYVDPVVNWTGPYIGAFVGYHAGRTTQSGCVGICPSSSDAPNVWYGGVQAGYDWQMPNNWVFGLQARLPVVAEDNDVTIAGVNFETRSRFQAAASARLGYATGMWLPYANVGIAVARNRITGPGGSDTNTHFGVGAGAGIEYRLSRNWSVDLRYMYAVFFKETYNIGGGPEKFGDNSSNVTLAVNYRF
jgi:opacity protein-like surface antigen